MRFTVLCDDQFLESTIIGKVIGKGTPLFGRHTYLPPRDANASVTHVLCHPSPGQLGEAKAEELARLQRACAAQVRERKRRK
jgi:hypothetical protein